MDLTGEPTMWDAKPEVTLHVEEAGQGNQGGPCVKIWRDPCHYYRFLESR